MKHYRKKNLNKVIPILKHLEVCRKITSMLLDVIDRNKEDVNTSYNDEILGNLSYMESNGIQNYGWYGFILNIIYSHLLVDHRTDLVELTLKSE